MSWGPWERVRELFHEALEMTPDERRALLEERCPNEPGVREEVASLLEAHDRMGLLDRPVHEAFDGAVRALVRDEDDEREGGVVPGTLLGPYRVDRELGRGGMGRVWLAHRERDDFTQEVAIKVLKRGMDTNEIVRRFKAERQTLAGLDHPSIAHIFDGGTTADGLPYFVMEYIDGRPIDRYCDDERLSIAARIDLFRTVCDTVHHAHGRLVAHCDLKPSNILVRSLEGEGPLVKLVDFGVARLLDPESRQGVTRGLGTWLTPEYASPEQLRRESLTTATDVWSLGVLLYELLTGRLPHGLDSDAGASPAELERRICEQTPPRPSEAARHADGAAAERRRCAGPAALAAQLEGDLDAIVGMALRVEPARRYASAADLSQDLRRQRESHPVSAREDSGLYRFSRFARRNRGLVAALALVFVSLLVGITGIAWQKRLADRRADTATRIRRELETIFERIDPDSGARPQDFPRLLEESAESVHHSLADEPAALASVLDTIGRTQHHLGRFEPAAQRLGEALSIRRALGPGGELDLAETLNHLAELSFDVSEIERARGFAEEAWAIRERRLAAPDPRLAQSLNQLGLLAHDQGQLARAEELHRRALAMRRELFGERHPDVALSWNNLGLTLVRMGRLEEAGTALDESLAISRQRPGDGDLAVARALCNLAFLAFTTGDLEAAEAHYEEALEIRRRLLGDDHAEVGVVLAWLGDVKMRLGEPEAGEQLLRRSLELLLARFGPRHVKVATVQSMLAGELHARGAHEEAEQLLTEAVDVAAELLGPQHPDVARMHNNLANVHAGQGEFERALPHYQAALTVQRAKVGEAPAALASVANDLGRTLFNLGRHDQALALYREAIVLRRGSESPPWALADTLTNLGELHLARGELDPARQALVEARGLLTSSELAGGLLGAQLDNAWGALLLAEGRAPEAEPLLAASLTVIRDRRGPSSDRTLRAEDRLARSRTR